MKKVLVSLVATLLVVWLVQWSVDSLLHSIAKGKCKRHVGKLRSITVALEEYRIDNGFYPVGCEISMLQLALAPEYIGAVPRAGVRYYSNGTDYDLLLLTSTEGPSQGGLCGEMEVRNGKWVRWPDLFALEELGSGVDLGDR